VTFVDFFNISFATSSSPSSSTFGLKTTCLAFAFLLSNLALAAFAATFAYVLASLAFANAIDSLALAIWLPVPYVLDNLAFANLLSGP
jgi:hypothetical protein